MNLLKNLVFSKAKIYSNILSKIKESSLYSASKLSLSSKFVCQPFLTSSFHTTTNNERKYTTHKEPENWLKYNDVVYPPQIPTEKRRPAEVVHQRSNIKYSQKKLWYIAYMIQGMSVDEAKKQLSFYNRKGGEIVKEIIEEGQQLAVDHHNVEHKSHMWIETAFVGKAKTIKGMRKHARRKPGIINYRYSHFFIRLREGYPPLHYFPPEATGTQLKNQQLQELRERKILYAL